MHKNCAPRWGRNSSDPGAPNGDMRLVEATTMHSAVQSIRTWVADHGATLPTCKRDS